MAEEKKVTKKKVTRRKKKTPTEVWQELTEEVDTENVAPYDMKETYAAQTALKHPKFGLGVITESLALKIEVAFEEGPKFLVHNRSRFN